jgi:hypothetical protein
MGLILIPRERGHVVFARLPGEGCVTGRWTRNRLKYTGTSWGFARFIVTWRLFHGRTRLAFVTRDEDKDLMLDDDLEAQLIAERTPLDATPVRGRRFRIEYRIGGSNHFGSCSLTMELLVDLARRTASSRVVSSYVDLDD